MDEFTLRVRAKDATSGALGEREPQYERVPAVVGRLGDNAVAVTDWPGRIFVRLYGDQRKTVQALCPFVLPYGSQVWVRHAISGRYSPYEVVVIDDVVGAEDIAFHTNPLQGSTTTIGDMLHRLAGTSSKGYALRLPLQVYPMQGYATGAGACVYNIVAGGGPGYIRWVASGGTTYKFACGLGQLPYNLGINTATNIRLFARLKTTGAGATNVNIQNWGVYAQVSTNGGDETWNVANNTKLGSTVVAPSWTDVQLLSYTPGANAGLYQAGSHFRVDFGPTDVSVSWAYDIVLGALWLQIAL